MITDDALTVMATDLVGVPGVVGVVLGGSRARGDALAGSDVDLGVYYTGRPDTDQLTRLASRWSTQPVEVGPPGSWGPWVDAGGWLTVDGTAVDWILRDLDRVRDAGKRAARGDAAFHPQAGHPLGFLDVAYVAELALGRVLADPTRTLSELRAAACPYPSPLRDAMVGQLWEAGFLIDVARKGVPRQDTTYVALCLARAVLLCAHALHADAGVWVTNEKGLVPGVARLGRAPNDFAARASTALGGLGGAGNTSESLTRAVATLEELVAETRQLLGGA